MTSPASGASSAPSPARLRARVPRSALGPALNDQGCYVGRVERNLNRVTDRVCQPTFLTTPGRCRAVRRAPTIGHNLRLAVDEIAADIEIFHHQH